MQNSKLFLIISLLGLSSIQGVSAFSLTSFFSSCSNLFSRATPTYNKNEPYYGLNNRDNVPHVIGGVGILSASILGVWWYRAKQKNKFFQRQDLERRKPEFVEQQKTQNPEKIRRQEENIERNRVGRSLLDDVNNCLSARVLDRRQGLNEMSVVDPKDPEKVPAILQGLQEKAQQAKNYGLEKNSDYVKKIQASLDWQIKMTAPDYGHVESEIDASTKAVGQIQNALKCILES